MPGASRSALVAACSAVFIAGQRTLLFAASPDDLSRAVYRTSHFVDARQVAQAVRDNTATGDRIAVFGSEPEIYFYSDRRAATGFIYMYPLMEKQAYAARMQGEMIQQVEAVHPKIVVAVLDEFSWLIRPESERRVLQWIPRYLSACYDRIDVPGLSGSAEDFQVYRWKSDHACGTGS